MGFFRERYNTAHDVTVVLSISDVIEELGSDLSEGCLIALVGRNGSNQVPNGEFTLEYGDHITVLGRQEAVSEALSQFHPHS